MCNSLPLRLQAEGMLTTKERVDERIGFYRICENTDNVLLTSWRQAPGPRSFIGTASVLLEGQ